MLLSHGKQDTQVLERAGTKCNWHLLGTKRKEKKGVRKKRDVSGSENHVLYC